MKTEKNIFIVFLLNAIFCVFEFVGGFLTGSVAILSDAVHDLGDASTLGLSYFFEKKSKRKPDDKYTFGYARFSSLASAITTLVLILGSVFVIYSSVERIINPVLINHDKMLIFAGVGVVLNFICALITRDKSSLNQRAVNLHLLEDMLGWIIVLIGSVIIKFTGLNVIDPILSILIAIVIFITACKNFVPILSIFLEKAPDNIELRKIESEVLAVEGVNGVHHVHIWGLDENNTFATMHVVANGDFKQVKDNVKKELLKHGIVCATLECESPNEVCEQKQCQPIKISAEHHHHHNHSHSHHHH